jgi:hypothetical protein
MSFTDTPDSSSTGGLSFGENWESGGVAPVEQPLVGFERARRRQAEAPQCGTRKLDGGLRACGDEVAVDDSALVDVAVSALATP